MQAHNGLDTEKITYLSRRINRITYDNNSTYSVKREESKEIREGQDQRTNK